MQTVVLNADFSYLNTVPWKKALKLMVKEKVEVLKETSTNISNSEKTFVVKIPLVLRLVYMVKSIYRSKVPWSGRSVFIRDNYECQYCGAEEELQLEHVFPSSRGGETSFKNCVASCKACNNKKGNRTPEEAGMKLRRVPYEPTVMDFLVHKMKNTGAYGFLKDLGVY